MTRAHLAVMLLALLLPSACATSGSSSSPGAPVPHAAGEGTGTPPDAGAPAPAPGSLGLLYRSDGSPASVDDIVALALERDVLFMGELHGDPGAHALQLELMEALIAASRAVDREIVLSLEMFERDVQPILDEYLVGFITESQFLAAARPWPNYERDYRPLVERAREEKLRVVAANAPRRYVNRVSRLGAESLDALPDEAKRHLPELPYPAPSPAYRAEWDARMAGAGHDTGHTADGGDRALQAQALWDAAMAASVHRVLEAGGAHPPLVLHVAGAFHVQNRTGTPEAIRHYRPGVRDLVVVTHRAGSPGDFASALEDVNARSLGDFILITPGEAP